MRFATPSERAAALFRGRFYDWEIKGSDLPHHGEISIASAGRRYL